MLGHVARWMRLAGFDTEYAGSDATDDDLLRQVATDQRTLVTRDVELAGRAARAGLHAVLLGEIKDAADALKQVIDSLALPLDQVRWFTRCTRCNGTLSSVAKATVKDRVHPAIFDRNDAFHVCDACGHVYWEGTHVGQIRTTLERLRSPAGGQSS